MILFSIIIVNFKTKELTKNCLDSLFKYCDKDIFEVILVDNNSGDQSVEFLQNNFKNKIKIIKSSENLGFGKANNLGAKIAQGEYLFLLNSDTLIQNNILKPLYRFLKKNLKSGIVSPNLFLENKERQSHAFGIYPTIRSEISNKFFYSRIKIINKPFKVDWVSGAAMIIRRKIFQEINGFDPNFFMYFEDLDLCLETKKRGWEIYVLPEIKLIHLGGKSSKNFIERKNYYYLSQDYFFKKHYGILVMKVMQFFRWPYRKFLKFKIKN